MARILRKASKVRTEKPFWLPLLKGTEPPKGGNCSGLLSLCGGDLAVPKTSACPAAWLEFQFSWRTRVNTFGVSRCLKCLSQAGGAPVASAGLAV